LETRPTKSGVIAQQLARENRSTVIIVTSKAHKRRVHKLWQMLSDGRNRASMRATPQDRFDPAYCGARRPASSTFFARFSG
jgi:hypothetical protein